jgi:phage-related protein
MQNNAIYSTMIRAGRTTFFIDVRQARNGNKYLQISESRLDADEKKFRTTIRVFTDSIEQFKQAINEACVSSQQ